MKLTVVIAVLIGMLVLACSSAAPAPVEPTPNIDATVEAKLAQERAVDATVEARAKEIVASQPTSIPSPTNTQAPIPTNTSIPQPTKTPKPVPTVTPTVVPTATSIPTPIPTAIPTPTLGPTPTTIPATATPLPTPLPAHFFQGCSSEYIPNTEIIHVFIGDVSNVDWSATRDGTSMSAWIGSVEMAHTQVFDGQYTLLVPGCSNYREFNYYYGETTIKFSIDGFWAEQSNLLGEGATILNLHQTNDPVVIN